MVKLSDHHKWYPVEDEAPTALPEAKDMNLWTQAKKKANAHFKGKKAPKHILDAWAVDWYTDKGGLFIEKGDGGLISETKNKAKDRNKTSRKQAKDAVASSIMLLPIFAKKLTTKERNALPASDFVYPDTREYPIQDTAHAIDALSRSTQSKDAAIIKKVHDAVYKRYPFLKKGKKSKASYAHGPHNLRILDNVLKTYAATKQIQVTPRGHQIIIVVNSTVLKLDRDALYQPSNSFSKIITKLADTLEQAPNSTTKDIMAQQQATLAKYQAMVQTYTDKIAKLKAEMQKHMAQE